MKKRLSALVLALVAGVIFGIQSPAQAATWGCPPGTGCVYTAYFGTGSKLVLSVGGQGQGVCHNFSSFGSGWDNTISSATAWYGSGLGLLLYDGINCTTPFHGVTSGSSDNFQGVLAFADNRASSFKIQTV